MDIAARDKTSKKGVPKKVQTRGKRSGTSPAPSYLYVFPVGTFARLGDPESNSGELCERFVRASL